MRGGDFMKEKIMGVKPEYTGRSDFKLGKVDELKFALMLYNKYDVNYLKFSRTQKNKLLAVYLLDGREGLERVLAPISRKIILGK